VIKINVEWEGKKGLENLIRYIDNNLIYGEAQEKITILGEKTAEHMRNTISTSKKRRSFGNNLEDNIISEIINSVGGIEVGIGRISHLKTNAPYFEVLDKGGYIPYSTVGGAPLGSFEGDAPNSSVVSGNQIWERSAKKGFFMKPKSPIEGIDYIGKAIRNLDKELKITMEELGAKFVNGLQQTSKQHGWGMGAGGAK
jgi:hypothetical protein